jgi:hypothetical protein
MILRANSPLRRQLGDYGLAFLHHSLGAFQRILPHVEITHWSQIPWQKAQSVWSDSRRREIRVTVPMGPKDATIARSFTTTVKRRRVAVASRAAGETLDMNEFNICKRIVMRISEVLEETPSEIAGATMRAIRDSFDEDVIAQYIESHYDLTMSITTLLADLHRLSEQTYENKDLSFSCIIDSRKEWPGLCAQFPRDFISAKKYKALGRISDCILYRQRWRPLGFHRLRYVLNETPSRSHILSRLGRSTRAK